MVECSLEMLPLLVILLVPHAQHRTLLSIEDLESCLISELLKELCKYYTGYMHMNISNDQVLAIAFITEGVSTP